MTSLPPTQVIDMARPSAIAAHAARTVLVASVIPMGIFYVVMATFGLSPAIIATVGWYYAGLLVRLIRRRPLVGATMLGAGLMTVRAVVAFWMGSSYLFFLQPVAGTVATAVSFAVTAMAGRPLLERLAHDFVPLPPALSQRLRATRFFDHTSLLWAAMYATNALGTVWLLTSSSLSVFLLMKTLLSPVLTGATVVVTYVWLRRLLHREGVHLRWQPRPLPA